MFVALRCFSCQTLTGRAILGSNKLRREVEFQCSEVILSPTPSAAPSEGKKKVMVQWDVKPERFMKDLDKFRGVRHIETDASTRPRQVRSMSRSSSRPDRSPLASNWAEEATQTFSLDLDAAAAAATTSDTDTDDVEIVDMDAAACAALPVPESDCD